MVDRACFVSLSSTLRWRIAIFSLMGAALTACRPDAGLKVFNTAPEATIRFPADGDKVSPDTDVVFIGTVSDVDHGFDELSVQWILDEDTVLCESSGVEVTGEVLCVAPAPADGAEIRLEVTDPLGGLGIDDVEISGVPTGAPVVQIVAPNDAGAFSTDQLTRFEGRVSDSEDAPETLMVRWESSLDGVLVEVDSVPTTTGQVLGFGRLSIGQHAISLWATDAEGKTTNAAVIVDVEAANQAPTAPTVSITPEAPQTLEPLLATATGSVNPDGSGFLTTRFIWTEDGALTDVTTATFPASRTTKDRIYRVVATPNDGLLDGPPAEAEVRVSNTPPSIAGVAINPTAPLDDDILVCAHMGFDDADGDADNATMEWTIAGVLIGTGDTLATGFVAGDSVRCTVTPNDGTDNGAPASDTVSVGDSNTPPVIASVSLSPASVQTDDTITANVTASDVDGDTITLAYAWFVDGSPVAGATGHTLSGATAFDRDQRVSVAVTPNDGTADGAPVVSDGITVDNTPPSIAGVAINPTAPLDDDILVCAHMGFDDADGDADNSTVEWTTDDMTTGSTYIGWDFSDDAGVWTIDEGSSYPCLQWQAEACPIPE